MTKIHISPNIKLLVGLIVASTISFPIAASAATLYAANAGSNSIDKISSTGVVSTFATGLSNPTALVFDSSGNLFEADAGSNSINKISSTGVVSTFATGLSNPTALVFDSSGNLFEADAGSNSINKISSTGVVSTFATGLSNPTALAFGHDPASTTAVPEPFTIIGTLIGGTVAFRMRKKLKAIAE
jgi:hypothetical protein